MAKKETNQNLMFDASTEAKPLFKERALWCMVLGLFFFAVYGSTNNISFLTAPHPYFFWEWERSLPFIPELVLPYMSSDILFVIAYLLAPTRGAIQKLGVRCGLAIVISAAFFILLPLQFSFERPEVVGWPKVLFDALSLDQPYNQFPSLHISLGFICWHTIVGRVGILGKTLVSVWFLMIGASTVLVFQHHFIDVVGGVATTVLIWWLVPNKGAARIPINFVTPRHLHMAFRYLVVATILVILCFNLGIWSLPLAWGAMSLLLVSGSYVLGLNGFLNKRSGRYPLLIWLLFGPYLIGSLLNWKYWRSKVPLMAEVEPGLWLGGRPASEDWRVILPKGVDAVIDLVPELSGTTPNELSHYHHPLLDIAIPSPAVLHDIASQIEECRQKGKVYVHCALGMSRSVLAVGAWMILNGCTKKEALARIDQVRPERVQRPYIDISLNLYEDYCRSNGAIPEKGALR